MQSNLSVSCRPELRHELYAALSIWSIKSERRNFSRNKYKVHGRETSPRRISKARKSERRFKVDNVTFYAIDLAS